MRRYEAQRDIYLTPGSTGEATRVPKLKPSLLQAVCKRGQGGRTVNSGRRLQVLGRVNRAATLTTTLLAAALVAVSSPLIAVAEVAPPASTAPAIGYFHSLPPTRILDTRGTIGGLPGKVRGGLPISVQVAGVGGVPSSGATAAIFNATVTEPTSASYLTLYPTGAATPLASNLNFGAGQTIPNQVVAKLGVGGKVEVFNAAGAAHVLLDVVGWYDSIFTQTASSQGSRLTSLPPSRILDTRNGLGASGKLGPAGVLAVQVAGIGGVGTGATAVVLNATATEPTAASYLTVYPSSTALPVASNLNFLPGQTVPNMVNVKLGLDGKVKVFNAAGSTHVILDVVGWYGPLVAGGGLGWAVTPTRILDTRGATGNLPGKLGAGAVDSLHVAGAGGLPASGMSAAVLNVTVTGPTAAGYLTVYPSGAARPVASSLNFVAGQTVPNLVLAKLGSDGNVNVFNAAGQTDVVVDVVAWYDGVLAQSAGNQPISVSDSNVALARAQAGTIAEVHNSLSIEQLRAHWTPERFARAQPAQVPGSQSASAVAEDHFTEYSHGYEYPQVVTAVGRLFYDEPPMPENDFSPDYVGVCSATVVARNLLITAAHCVVKHSDANGLNYEFSNFAFVPNENGATKPYGIWYADGPHYWTGYLTNVDFETGAPGSFPPLDYAILTMPPQGNQNAYIGDATRFILPVFNLAVGGAKYSVGYPSAGVFSNISSPPGYCSPPGYKPGNAYEWCYQYYCFAPLSKWKQYLGIWWTGGFGCRTGQGASGGPIFEQWNGSWYVSSVNSRGPATIEAGAPLLYNLYGPYFDSTTQQLYNMFVVG